LFGISLQTQTEVTSPTIADTTFNLILLQSLCLSSAEH